MWRIVYGLSLIHIFGHEEKTETQPNPLDEYNEVIGKTKIVYLEDPDAVSYTHLYHPSSLFLLIR